MSTGLDAQQKIFASNPDDRRAFEALEEHFFLEGAWDALVALYRSRIGAPAVEADETLRCPLLFRLGQILEERGRERGLLGSRSNRSDQSPCPATAALDPRAPRR